MIVRFEDVITRVTGNVDRYNTDLEYYVGGEQYDSSALTIERRGDLKKDVDILGFKFHFPFKSGDVLLMARNPHLRKAGQVFFDGLCSDASYILRTKNPEVLLQDFIPILLQRDHFWDFFESHKTGGITFLMNWGMLKTYEFDLPRIEIQREVMEKVWAAYRLKQSYQKLIEATDEMVKSQFIEMFGKRSTTPVGNYIKDSFPGEWGKEDKEGNGVKVIRTTNFTNSGKLNLSEVVSRSIEERKVQKKQIQKYDTILERSGGTADNPVGRVVLFEEDEQYLCNNFTQVLRFKDIEPRFTFYALFYFYQTNKTAIRSMGSKTTGIQNLNMSKYLEIGIPNANEFEQKQFVSIAEQTDKSKFELKKSIEAIDKVIKSLINSI